MGRRCRFGLYVSEPGVPQITINPGTPSPFPSDTGGAGTGGGGTGGGGNVGSSDALNTMMGTAWGNTAVANAESLGVNPSALAATCVLEFGLSERRRFRHCRRRLSDDGIDLHCDDKRGGRTEPITGGPDCAWPRGPNGVPSQISGRGPGGFWCKLIERRSWPICASGTICGSVAKFWAGGAPTYACRQLISGASGVDRIQG